MAHFHHRHAAALEIEDFGLGFFENRDRQHGGAGVEIMDTLYGGHFFCASSEC